LIIAESMDQHSKRRRGSSSSRRCVDVWFSLIGKSQWLNKRRREERKDLFSWTNGAMGTSSITLLAADTVRNLV